MKLNNLSKLLLGGMLLLGALTPTRADDQKVDPSGTYIWTVQLRKEGGVGTNTLVLKLDGDKLTGSLSMAGHNSGPTDITGGTLSGSNLCFLVVHTANGSSRTNKYTGTLADGTIKGKFVMINQNGGHQLRDWEATLQK